MTNTTEHSLDVITSKMASLSAQMMYFGQSLTDRMGQLHSTVTGMQQATDMLTNTLHAIGDQNKDMQNHLTVHDKCLDDIAKILKPLPSQTTPLHFSQALYQNEHGTVFTNLTFHHHPSNSTATICRGHHTFCYSTILHTLEHNFIEHSCQTNDLNMACNFITNRGQI